jgi:hydroxymethylpyrimidine/phosphomethylpyrimidine kinase
LGSEAADLTIPEMKVALSIAGSDPTGGAGLQLDLQVFRTLGVHGQAVPTALTVQDTRGVKQVLPSFPSVVGDQLRALSRDCPPHALKIGMLATDDVARAVAHALDDMAFFTQGLPPLVVDPILDASDGKPLLERRAIPALQELLARASLATPNRSEAERLVGEDVSTRGGVEIAARRFVSEIGCAAVLIKGGHAQGPADDCLARRGADGVTLQWLEGERIPGAPVHGTGCALSAAVAAGFAAGVDLDAAVARARRLVAEGIRDAFAIGSGARILGLS